MTRFGLLVEYDFCTGCHVCEIACKQEHDLAEGKWGIKLTQNGPMQIDEDKWVFDNVPVPTELCDFCEHRVKKGLKPACVAHCQPGIMKYATVDELVEYMKLKRRSVLYVR